MSDILKLIETIGGCVLYHDYRSGSFRDWSGNDNDGTPNGSSLDRDGCSIPTQTSNVYVPFDSSLDIGAAGAASFLALLPQEYESRSGSQQRIFDANSVFASYIDGGGDTFYFLVAGVQKSALIPNDDLNKSRGFGVSWADGEIADLYLNGVYGHQIGTALNTGTTDQDLYIGNRAADNRSLMQKLSALLIFDKKLTATEHSEVYGALAAARWPTKVYSHTRGNLAIDRDESGLVLGLEMDKVGDTVYDRSTYQNDGNQAKTITRVDGFARGLSFDGVGSGIAVNDDPSLRVASGSITISVWLKFDSITGFGPIFAKGSAATDQNYYLRNDDGKLEFYFRNLADTQNTQYQTTGDPLVVGETYHIVFKHTFGDGSSTKVFINGGVQAGSWVSGDSNDLPLPNTNDPVLIGERSDYFEGTIYQLQFFTELKSDAWVAAEYAKGAKALFATGFGARETTANVTSGQITNTPFDVVSGTWALGTETVNGKVCKVLQCLGAGVCGMPISHLRQGDKDAAAGTFTFWLYKGTTNTLQFVQFIANQVTAGATAGFNGYSFRFDKSERAVLRRTTNGSSIELCFTDVDYVDVNEWTKVTITVDVNRQFSVYVNDALVPVVSGTNPVTNSDHTESKYIVLDFDAFDKIALGAIDGSYALTKYLGVV